MDELKAKDRIIFSLEKELETQTGYVQKLQLQKEALDEQLFLVKEAECNMSSPKREIPGRAGDGSEHCSSPVSRSLYFITKSNIGALIVLVPPLPSYCISFLLRHPILMHKQHPPVVAIRMHSSILIVMLNTIL